MIIANKMAFIRAVIESRLELRNVKKVLLLEKMQGLGLVKYSAIVKVESTKLATFKEDNKEDVQEGDENEQENESKNEYDYLLRMPLWSLTLEKVEQLAKELAKKEAELNILVKTTI